MSETTDITLNCRNCYGCDLAAGARYTDPSRTGAAITSIPDENATGTLDTVCAYDPEFSCFNRLGKVIRGIGSVKFTVKDANLIKDDNIGFHINISPKGWAELSEEEPENLGQQITEEAVRYDDVIQAYNNEKKEKTNKVDPRINTIERIPFEVFDDYKTGLSDYYNKLKELHVLIETNLRNYFDYLNEQWTDWASAIRQNFDSMHQAYLNGYQGLQLCVDADEYDNLNDEESTDISDTVLQNFNYYAEDVAEVTAPGRQLISYTNGFLAQYNSIKDQIARIQETEIPAIQNRIVEARDLLIESADLPEGAPLVDENTPPLTLTPLERIAKSRLEDFYSRLQNWDTELTTCVAEIEDVVADNEAAVAGGAAGPQNSAKVSAVRDLYNDQLSNYRSVLSASIKKMLPLIREKHYTFSFSDGSIITYSYYYASREAYINYAEYAENPDALPDGFVFDTNPKNRNIVLYKVLVRIGAASTAFGSVKDEPAVIIRKDGRAYCFLGADPASDTALYCGCTPITGNLSSITVHLVGEKFIAQSTGFMSFFKPDKWWLFPENLPITSLPDDFPDPYYPGYINDRNGYGKLVRPDEWYGIPLETQKSVIIAQKEQEELLLENLTTRRSAATARMTSIQTALSSLSGNNPAITETLNTIAENAIRINALEERLATDFDCYCYTERRRLIKVNAQLAQSIYTIILGATQEGQELEVQESLETLLDAILAELQEEQSGEESEEPLNPSLESMPNIRYEGDRNCELSVDQSIRLLAEENAEYRRIINISTVYAHQANAILLLNTNIDEKQALLTTLQRNIEDLESRTTAAIRQIAVYTETIAQLNSDIASLKSRLEDDDTDSLSWNDLTIKRRQKRAAEQDTYDLQQTTYAQEHTPAWYTKWAVVLAGEAERTNCLWPRAYNSCSQFPIGSASDDTPDTYVTDAVMNKDRVSHLADIAMAQTSSEQRNADIQDYYDDNVEANIASCQSCVDRDDYNSDIAYEQALERAEADARAYTEQMAMQNYITLMNNRIRAAVTEATPPPDETVWDVTVSDIEDLGIAGSAGFVYKLDSTATATYIRQFSGKAVFSYNQWLPYFDNNTVAPSERIKSHFEDAGISITNLSSYRFDSGTGPELLAQVNRVSLEITFEDTTLSFVTEYENSVVDGCAGCNYPHLHYVLSSRIFIGDTLFYDLCASSFNTVTIQRKNGKAYIYVDAQYIGHINIASTKKITRILYTISGENYSVYLGDPVVSRLSKPWLFLENMSEDQLPQGHSSREHNSPAYELAEFDQYTRRREPVQYRRLAKEGDLLEVQKWDNVLANEADRMDCAEVSDDIANNMDLWTFPNIISLKATISGFSDKTVTTVYPAAEAPSWTQQSGHSPDVNYATKVIQRFKLTDINGTEAEIKMEDNSLSFNKDYYYPYIKEWGQPCCMRIEETITMNNYLSTGAIQDTRTTTNVIENYTADGYVYSTYLDEADVDQLEKRAAFSMSGLDIIRLDDNKTFDISATYSVSLDNSTYSSCVGACVETDDGILTYSDLNNLVLRHDNAHTAEYEDTENVSITISALTGRLEEPATVTVELKQLIGLSSSDLTNHFYCIRQNSSSDFSWSSSEDAETGEGDATPDGEGEPAEAQYSKDVVNLSPGDVFSMVNHTPEDDDVVIHHKSYTRITDIIEEGSYLAYKTQGYLLDTQIILDKVYENPDSTSYQYQDAPRYSVTPYYTCQAPVGYTNLEAITTENYTIDKYKIFVSMSMQPGDYPQIMINRYNVYQRFEVAGVFYACAGIPVLDDESNYQLQVDPTSSAGSAWYPGYVTKSVNNYRFTGTSGTGFTLRDHYVCTEETTSILDYAGDACSLRSDNILKTFRVLS